MAIATTMPPGRYWRGASPEGAYWWLHAKPLDAAIRLVLAQYWPGGRHGHRCRRCVQNTNKTQLQLAIIVLFY